jgi:hypothetical protein
MSRGRAVRSSGAGKEPPAAPAPIVKEALEVTWTLKGHLKNAQVAYIRVGVLLAKVRNEKLYAALGHPDMESYAEERLHLGRTSLYKYLQVHDWVSEFHKEWLEPRPKGFIPDLSDVADLIFIERELARKDLDPKKRAELDDLRKKALEGRLRKGDLGRWRRQGPRQGEDALKSFLSKLRLLRKHGSALASMPPEVISHLDAAIDILKNAHTLQLAGINLIGARKRTPLVPKFIGVIRSYEKS